MILYVCLFTCIYYCSCKHENVWVCERVFVCCMEEVPVFSLSHPCLQLGFGEDNVWFTARWAHQKSISIGVWGASWERAHLQDQQTSWKRCHILQRWKRRSICVCIALFLLDWSSLLWTCNLALMRERLFPNWKSCFDQKLYYILVYAVLGRIQPKNQNHIRWPHRKNLTWKIIYKVLERQLKQPGERWVNPEIRRCRKLLLLLGQEGQGEQVGSRLGLRHGSWDSGGAPCLGRTTGERAFLEGAIEKWSHCPRCLLKQREGEASSCLPFSPLQFCPRASCLPSLTKMPLARKSGNHSLENWASHRVGQRGWMCTERIWEQNGNNQQR